MGYSIYIKSDKEIDLFDLDDIVAELPDYYKEGASKQSWGWSLYADVSLLEDKKQIRISGAYGISGKNAEGLTLQILNKLLKRGYNCTCESSDYQL